MQSGAPQFIVACCTPGCYWEEECPTRREARLAGRVHEEAHEFHVTGVFPLDETKTAA